MDKNVIFKHFLISKLNQEKQIFMDTVWSVIEECNQSIHNTF